jgi:formiminotetrahydrofolate cyclodeaminase
MISDVGTGALLGLSGAKAAGYNVRINLPHIGDEAARVEMREKLDALLAEAETLAVSVEKTVEEALA